MGILLDKINILLIVVFLLNLSLGGVIFFNGPKKKTNKIYSAVCLVLLGWIFGMIFYRSASKEMGLIWCTFLYVVATVIPSIFLYFTYIFPSEKDRNISSKALIIFVINAIVAVMVMWPGFIIRAVNIRPGLEKEIIFTGYYWFYFFYISILFSYGFWRLFQKYLKSSGIEKQQILYLLLGDALAANLAFVTNLIMPWFGYFFLNWLGQVFTIVMVGFASYAIVRYRLMDIRVVARKIFIYFGLAGLVYGFFYLTIWSYNYFLGGIYSGSAYFAGIVMAPLFIFVFYSTEKWIKIIANKYFFASLYNYHETINKLITELNHYIDLRKIIDTIVDTIKRTMQLDRAGVLLVDPESQPIRYQISKVVGFNIHNGISLVEDNFLTRYLQKTQRPLVREELIYLAENSVSQKDKQAFQKLHDDMKHIEASLCLPLMSSKKLIGIIVLGSKISKDAYTKEDLDLLDTLSKQAGIAVENAQLYQKIRDFSKTLEQKVNEQTKDLRDKADHLQRLLTMRSQFLDIASHQLKTPVSVILGTASMFKEGAMDKLPKEKQLHFIDNIFVKAKKLNNIISDILKASEMDSEDFTLKTENIKKTQVMNVINEVADELKPMAEERQLMFEVVKPRVKLPEIMADAIFLKHAIYNLADNAIKYTKEGFVKIEAISDKENIHLKISDSGIGIPEKDQKKMFDKFARASNAVNMYTDGSGLGIFIVKKVIDAQEGKVWFESEENKGTTFYIDLPLKNKYG